MSHWIRRNPGLAVVVLATSAIALLLPAQALATSHLKTKASVPAPSRAPAAIAPSQSPLEVKGQTRAWSQMVRARGEKDSVNFVRTRVDYRSEIEAARF